MMTAKQISTQIRQQFNLRRISSQSAEWVLGEVCHKYHIGDLPLAVDTAAYGIHWAMATGRLPGRAETAIRQMTAREVIDLVAAVAVTCPTSGDVSAYLIQRFAA